MKNKIITLLALSALLFTACDPIEDRDDMGRLLTESELAFDLIQEPAGSNTIIFENKTPAVIPYFDWGAGFSNKARTEAYIPFAGDYKVTFTAYTGGGAVSVTRDFTVAQNDPVYFEDPAWDLITGDGAGKTWEFASDITTFNGYIWGNGAYKGMPPGPSWWGRSAADAADDKIDLNAELYFDLEGAANIRSVSNGATTTGTFDIKLGEKVLSDDGQVWSIGSLELAGTTIPHGISINEGSKLVYKFDICTLNEDELILAYNTGNDGGSGSETWFWRFKRKGFKY